MITLVIPGIPVPWKAHSGFGRRSFNPRFKEREYYQHEIRKQYNKFASQGPIWISCTYVMPIPKSASKKKRELMIENSFHHIIRPDVDNLNKFLNDCLKTIIFRDDSQVVQMNSNKKYGLIPQTIVEIY